MPTPVLLDTTEAAKALKVSYRTLCKWRLQGRGPVYCKVGRCVRYRADDLENFLNASKVVSSSQVKICDG